MLNNIEGNKILNDLQEGLTPLALASHLRDHGKLLLKEELENLMAGAPPNDYAHLRDKLWAAKNLKGPVDIEEIEFDKIESVDIQKRLKRALGVFGALVFYDTVDKLYEEKVNLLLNNKMLELMRGTPLKEFNYWVSANYGMRGEVCYEINYAAIKKPLAKKLVQELAELYGGSKVGKWIDRHSKALISDRIALLVESQDSALDPVKAYSLVQAMITAANPEN